MIDFFPGTSREAEFKLYRYGTVAETGPQGVKVRFDGETSAGDMHYTRLSSYTPAVGDRVLLIRCKSDYIAGELTAREQPSKVGLMTGVKS